MGVGIADFVKAVKVIFLVGLHVGLHIWTQINKQTVGPFTLAKTKIQKNCFFFVVPFTLPEKPITLGFLGTKSTCAKNPESHTGVLVSGAHARLLSNLWPYTCSAHYVAGRGRVIPLKVRYHVTKNPNNTLRDWSRRLHWQKPLKNPRS